MTWQLALYMVSGFFLMLLWLAMDDDLDGFGVRLALFVGPFVGVPVFIIMLLLFFNWGLLFRKIRAALSPEATKEQP